MELDQLEALALAPAALRERALEQLIPGTEDHYFHRCLFDQHAGELEAVEATLRTWIDRHGETARVREIRTRQLLLGYGADPEGCYAGLRDALDLRFDHQRQVEGAPSSLPTRLEPEAISRLAFQKQAIRQYSGLDGFHDRALRWLAEGQRSVEQLRALLDRLRRPDLPKLVELVARELADPRSAGFGKLAIHSRMTLAQLDALAEARPELGKDPRFVATRVSRLRPGPDVDLDDDPEAMDAYLGALWAYAEGLDPVHNSLKVHALYHRLEVDRRRGVYDRARFEAYLQLPRDSPVIAPAYRQAHRRALAELHDGFSAITVFDAVGDDRELIRDYLGRFFAAPEAQDPEIYAAWLDADFLRQSFAEAKILAGVGDRERWYSLLDDADAYRALAERVEIEFAPQNPRRFALGEAVRLEVEVKNVPSLVVKVFEIDTLAYFLAHGRELDEGVDLDGLVANHEQRFDYDDPPLRRVRRSLSFDSITAPGSYVVELIGNGRSSRALIEIGELHCLGRLGAAGHVLRVVDEAGELVPAASLCFGGREYPADERGDIRLPYASSPRRAKVLLCAGGRASIRDLQLEAESYELEARFHVEREQLIAGAKAKLLIRARARVNGVAIDPKLLDEPRLTLRSTQLDGTRSSVTVPVELGSSLDAELVHEFEVPEQLCKLEFCLRAKIRSVSEQREVELEADEALKINEIDRSATLADVHLMPTQAGWVLELRGKSGEPRPNTQVNFAFSHRDMRPSLGVALQTDARGRVELGALVDIAWVEASLAGGHSRSWTLPRPELDLPDTLQLAAGDELALPLHTAADAELHEQASLLELGQGGYVRERSEALALEPGTLRVRGLEPGDYHLSLFDHDRVLTLRVAGPGRAKGWALSPRRQLELSRRDYPRVIDLAAEDGQVRVELAGLGPRARVHLFASRYLAKHRAAQRLRLRCERDLEAHSVERRRNRYLSGRDIGDEYRYILDRKRADIYAGNMLARPGLLLNPWARRKTSTSTSEAVAGGAFGSAAKPAAAPARARAARKQRALREEPSANLDFLVDTGHVHLNLLPDEDGRVTIPRSELGEASQVEIVVVDDATSATAHLALAEQPEPALHDRRLGDALDPAGHFIQAKRFDSLGPGGELVIEDLRTAKLELVDTLAKAHALLSTLAQHEALAEFEFLTRWPSLEADEQRRLYSKYACHELNLFLARKDREFFTALIQPYLANKRDKTFMDHYLLEDDLRAFLEPWAYGRLNALERILLAGRVDGEGGPEGPTARHLSDRVDLIPPDPEGHSAIFDVALQGSALASEDRLGVDAARSAIPRRGGGGAKRERSGAAPPPPPQAAPAAGAAPPAPRSPGAPKLALAEDDAEFAAAGLDIDGLEADGAARAEMRRMFRPADKTEEWAENNYYRVFQAGPELIEANGFWRDLAVHEGDGPFVSGNFIHASSTLAEALCALAVLDLPFEAEAPTTSFEGTRMRLKVASPAVVFHRQITPTDAAEPIGVLASQVYLRDDDRYRWQGDEQRDNYVGPELLVHTVYACRVVLTNPSSSAHELELLVQIPAGALPLAGGRPTRDLHVHIEPHGTHAFEYKFYFPEPGRFTHFPVHVSKNQVLVCRAEHAVEGGVLELVRTPSTVDRESWSHLSQHGSEAEVLAFLERTNLERLSDEELDRVLWRAREREFFTALTQLLQRRHRYHAKLWSYALHHRDPEAAGVYLRHEQALVARCGQALDAPLLAFDAVERGFYSQLEYAPLINARAHQLGAKREILNEGLAQQYRHLLETLRYRPEPGSEDLLAAASYMFCQDRIGEGLALLERVDPSEVSEQLQLDYLRAYAALFTLELDAARELAEPHRDHPVDRWRKRFAALLAALDEATGSAREVVDADDRDEEQARLAAGEPSLDFEVEGETLILSYQNLARCELSFYRMDIELLFSRQPFMQDPSKRFAIVRANHREEVELPAGGHEHRVPLPPSYRSANAVIEARGGGLSRARANYAHDLAVRVIEQFGQLRVARRSTATALPRAYVKVYARRHDGRVSFYKDGYTDLRGAFDYASLSTDELDAVARFAILVMSEERGALIREAAPPQR